MSDLNRYRNWALATALALLLGACSNAAKLQSPVQSQTPAFPAAGQLIELNSPEGEKRLFESSARSDFLPLGIHFETQQNPAYCGVASMAMVLNAMKIPAPIAPEYRRYPMFTQNNLFNDRTERIVSVNTVARQGMALEQLGRLLAAHGLRTKSIHAGDINADRFRALAVENLRQSGNFVLVNYLRKSIGQETGGHISPLAAYHQASDSFLILDVSRYKYPPVWVGAEQLWQAMNTVDPASGKTRGLVLVGELNNVGRPTALSLPDVTE